MHPKATNTRTLAFKTASNDVFVMGLAASSGGFEGGSAACSDEYDDCCQDANDCVLLLISPVQAARKSMGGNASKLEYQTGPDGIFNLTRFNKDLP